MEALGPPPGGDRSRASSVRIATLTTLVLVFISTSLRIITRRWVVGQFGWDDLTIILATVSTSLQNEIGSKVDRTLDRNSCLGCIYSGRTEIWSGTTRILSDGDRNSPSCQMEQH